MCNNYKLCMLCKLMQIFCKSAYITFIKGSLDFV